MAQLQTITQLVEHNGFLIRVVEWKDGFIAWSTRRDGPETSARIGHWYESLDEALRSAKALIDR
jgi:hypothetical protein